MSWMLWGLCFIYAIIAILLRNEFPIMGALGVFLIPLLRENKICAGWRKMRIKASKYLLAKDYCIHYSKHSALPNPKNFCNRAGRINCAACIAEVMGLEAKDILNGDELRGLPHVQGHGAGME